MRVDAKQRETDSCVHLVVGFFGVRAVLLLYFCFVFFSFGLEKRKKGVGEGGQVSGLLRMYC